MEKSEIPMVFSTIFTIGTRGKFIISTTVAFLSLIILIVAATAEIGTIPDVKDATAVPKVNVPFDINSFKSKWRNRIKTIRNSGKLPIIDIESSYDPKKLNIREFANTMDEEGIALIAFSPQVGEKGFKEGKLWTDHVRHLISADPWRYIPTTVAGIHPAWTEKPEDFLNEQIRRVKECGYPLMGEFEFRHYPSPRQYKRGEMFRDVEIPINGKIGHRLFAFSQESGIPFQIHYEIEDKLLPALEEMLGSYPGAKVIWCHLAQIRYHNSSTIYSPDYVEKMIKKYPNIYFDTAFGDPRSLYPGSGERHAHIWEGESGRVKKEWIRVITTYPWRFLAAMDIGGDRMDELPRKSKTLRMFLENLPEDVREIVAYKAAWKLLFNEEF